jgi:DegV family protein with EDD domain
MEPIVRIVTDSRCDLPRWLVERFKIPVVSLVVRFGSEVYEDIMLSVEEFWRKASSLYHPQTSQPSIGAFEQAFERLIAQGKQALCLTVTGRHSGTFNAARLAAQRLVRRCGSDSFSLSLGLGVEVVEAAQAAGAGCSMQEILELLEDLRERMRLVILLDTLDNLRLGGRADGFIGIAERMMRALDIKTVINVVDGQLRLLGAARSFKGGLRRLMDIKSLGPLEHLAVVHTRGQALAEELADRLAERSGFPLERIWVRETGAVLSTHGGRGVIGVMAMPAK